LTLQWNDPPQRRIVPFLAPEITSAIDAGSIAHNARSLNAQVVARDLNLKVKDECSHDT